MVMVFNATFNNISVILWRLILLVEETRVPGENHRSVASHWQTSSHNVVTSTPHPSGIRTHNYHMIMTTVTTSFGFASTVHNEGLSKKHVVGTRFYIYIFIGIRKINVNWYCNIWLYINLKMLKDRLAICFLRLCKLWNIASKIEISQNASSILISHDASNI